MNHKIIGFFFVGEMILCGIRRAESKRIFEEICWWNVLEKIKTLSGIRSQSGILKNIIFSFEFFML